MNKFGEFCIKLRKKGCTLPEIMRITGRPKTSIYFHIRAIPLSASKRRSIREASGKRIREFSIARKGKSERSFHMFDTWNKDNILLLGHLLFDGEITKGKCSYNNRSQALITRVEDLMHTVYDFEPKTYQNKLTGVFRISYYNVALAGYLRNRARDLLRNIKKLPLDLKREFLRAFFDDEGCMDFRPKTNRREVRGYQKNVQILRTVKKILHDFNIESRTVPPNEVVVSGKGNLCLFEQQINFSAGIYMNGNRSNSRWKKHIEKRKLLRMAIESFKR